LSEFYLPSQGDENSMSVYGKREHTLLKQLLFWRLSGSDKRYVADEPRTSTPFYSCGLACHFDSMIALESQDRL
jgi:hypothetical protein